MAEPGRQYLHGLHAVAALLERAPERVLEIWIAAARDDQRIRELRRRAEAAGLRVQSAAPGTLAAMAGPDAVHQGAVAAIRPANIWDESALLAALDRLAEDALLLVLDGVTDPRNFGACLRTAEAAGVHAVVLPRDRAATIDGAARKAAAGAAEFVQVAAVTNLARTLDRLKERHVWIAGTAADAPATIYSADLRGPLALVLGAEGAGMRRLTRERCDFLARIPMAGRAESLNVSVAAGIALFEARRQRTAEGGG
ncbi:MAG TPA: 23S rRNA (guanosine(2251)-2'-O)-methyltransferase RlmB [Steroidobacteraceae bacterium]|nr:23S rRNA (guanosine(2251)-2'-O)-methyltransferase RlmB [Steroidobacteraceae bacterium]